MGFLIFLGAILILFLAYFIAKEFEAIAEYKGYNGKKYFWWTFWLNIVGMRWTIGNIILQIRI